MLTPKRHRRQGPVIPEEKAALLPELIEPWFMFALVWAVPASCDSDGRKNFDLHLRKCMKQANVSTRSFPELGTLRHKYQYNQGSTYLNLPLNKSTYKVSTLDKSIINTLI